MGRREGEPKQRIAGFADRVVAIAFSPDGKHFATGGGAPTEDGEIKLFDVAAGKLVIDIKNGHSDTVFGVAFSPDDKMLATCGADKFVKVFEVPLGQVPEVVRGAHAPRHGRRLDAGRQDDRQRRGRQRRQGLGLREGRAGPRHAKAHRSR